MEYSSYLNHLISSKAIDSTSTKSKWKCRGQRCRAILLFATQHVTLDPIKNDNLYHQPIMQQYMSLINVIFCYRQIVRYAASNIIIALGRMQVNILFIGIQNSDYLHDHHSPSKSMNPPSPFSTYFQQKIKIDNKQLQFKLWNPAGQEQYKKLRQLSFYEMDAIIIAFLITESNLSLVQSYYQQIRSKQAKRLHNIYLLPKQYQNPSQVEQTLKSHSIPSMLDHSTYIILEESALFEKIARKYIEQQNQLKIRQSQCCIIY